jgi:hypothetical protein
MTLQKQLVPIILGQGIDTKTDSKVVSLGKLLQLENGSFEKRGKITKTPGYTKLSNEILGSSDLISDPKALFNFKDDLLTVSGGKLYSYASSSDAWVDKGNVSAVGVLSKSIVRNTASQTIPDVATTQGITIYAWEDSRGGIRATVIDENSGLPVQNDVQIDGNGTRPRVSATSNYLYVHFMDSSNTFKCRRLNPLEPTTFEAAITLASDANGTNPNYDISRLGNNLIFCYQTTGNVVKSGYLNALGDIAGVADGFPTPIDTADSGSGAVAIVGRIENDSNDAIYTFYHNTTDGLQCDITTLDLATTDTVVIEAITTQVNQITAVVDGSQTFVWYEVNAASTYNRRIKFDIVNRDATVESSGTSTGTGNEFIRSVGIASKAFIGADDKFLVAVHESEFQPTYFLLKYISETQGFVSTTISKDESGGLHARRSVASNVATIGDTQRIFPSVIKTRLVSEDSEIFGLTGIQSNLLSFDDSSLYQTKELGENLHIAGGVLLNYDGKSVTEHGFFLFPENISNTVNAASGSIEAGSRQYVVVFEWTDNQGQIHQSAPSLPIEVDNILNDSNTLTIPTLRLTEKKGASNRSEVSVAVYRTIDGPGSVFYKVTSITSPVNNTVSSDTVTFEDDASDDDITSNQILYTTGGIVDNIQPESATLISEFGDRLILNAEDPNVLQYSKKTKRNEGISFSDEFTFRADKGGERITATASLDEKLVIFKERKILIQVGQGPTESGALNDFSTPPSIPSDVGCMFPRSIVEVPQGLIFKSNKGFFLLDRGLSTSYIGAEVEAYNSLSVTSAVLISDKNQVRFTHSDGLALIYDFNEKQWGTLPNHEAIGATFWDGQYCFIATNGNVYKTSSTSYLRAGKAVSTKIQTSWIQPAGLMAAQRVYRLILIGNLKSQHKLRVKIAYDFHNFDHDTFFYDTQTILGSSYSGSSEYFGADDYFGGSDDLYQVEIKPTIQKCQSFRLTIDDLNPDINDGAGFELVGIVAEVGVKKGAFRVPATKRVGPS